MRKVNDLTGKKFGKLTVKYMAPKTTKKTYWICECECGNIIKVRSDSLTMGKTKSCGCLKKEQDYINLVLNSKSKEITYINKICLNCGKNFTVEKTEKNRKFCSQECAHEHSRGENSPHWKGGFVNVKCAICGKEIQVPPYRGNKEIYFCSNECRSKYGSMNFSGENNPNYNPNLTQEDREKGRHIEGYEEWRKEVLKRDNYTCQVTGKRGGDLVVHHLYSYNKYPCLRTVIDNGITISKEMHKEFHEIYGYGDNTEEQFIDFLVNRYLGAVI